MKRKMRAQLAAAGMAFLMAVQPCVAGMAQEPAAGGANARVHEDDGVTMPAMEEDFYGSYEEEIHRSRETEDSYPVRAENVMQQGSEAAVSRDGRDSRTGGPEEKALEIYHETEETGKESTSARTGKSVEKAALTGAYGENLTYSFNPETGVLTFSGTGEMKHSSSTRKNWELYSYINDITEVIIEEGITTVGNYTFQDCENLKSVSLPQSMSEIGDYGFFRCGSLSDISIPSSVTWIGSYALAGLDALTEMVLPEGMRYIADYAFAWDENLEKITLPSTLTEIRDGAFLECHKLAAPILPQGLQSIEYGAFFNCYAFQEIVIPDSVTSLGDIAFIQCKGLKKVTVSKGLAEIPDSAFQGCSALEEVVLPESITKIGEEAFASCISLTSVKLPQKVTSIGKSAFAFCAKLKELELPSGITEVGENAFRKTPFLESISSNEFVILGGTMLYAYNGNSAKVVIPSEITKIADGAFKEHTEITEVVMPDSLEQIGTEAFSGCTSLETVSVPEGVTSIGKSAFDQTPFQENLPEGLTVLGRTVYRYTGSDTEVTIPDGVVSISPEAFIFCFELERVAIPDTVREIGTLAFLGCTSLVYTELPDSVEKIGERALGYYCVNGTDGMYLEMDMYLGGQPGTEAEAYAESNRSIEFLPSGSISGTCGEPSWTLNLSSGELVISGSGAIADYLYYSSQMSPFHKYQDLITSVRIEEGITAIGTYAFYELSRLKTVALPRSLESVGDSAFCSCVAVEAIEIPAQVAAIDYTAFRGCAGLKAIHASEENAAYSSVDGVLYNKEQSELIKAPDGFEQSEFTVPETVLKIGDEAFADNIHLRRIILPESVERLGKRSFYDATSLKTLIFHGKGPRIPYSNQVFDTKGLTIYCSFSDAQWQSVMESVTDWVDKTWMDLDGVRGIQTLSLVADRENLQVGETLQIETKLDPALCAEFVWKSSNPVIADVMPGGTLISYAPGTVTVSVESPDGMYRAEKNFTVTGTAPDLPAETEVIPLTDGELSFESVHTETMQIPCPEKNGIYFLSGPELSFYSLAAKRAVPVFTFEGCTRAYAEAGKLYVVYGKTCTVYDLNSRSIELKFFIPGYTATAVGADTSGRIYVAADRNGNAVDHRVFLYSPEGELLSQMCPGTEVYRLNGFDSTNGNFYMETLYDFYSWGYSHPGNALRMGNVTDNQIRYVETYYSFQESGIITRTMSNIMYLCQDVSRYHQNSAALLGDRYLVGVSALSNEIRVMDSHSETLRPLLQLPRTAVESELPSSYYDTASIGVRAVYHEENDSMLIYENNRKLTEYDIKTGKKLSEYQTAHKIFNMFWQGSRLVLVEKEDDAWYLETVEWKKPDSIQLTGERTMEVGDAQSLTVQTQTPYTVFFNWSSSDSSIVSVSSDGELNAWKEGTATITVSDSSQELSAQLTVTVSGGESAEKESAVVNVPGAASDNLARNTYTVWSRPVWSYLSEREDGTLERLEYIENSRVILETWSSSGKLLGSRTITRELPIFGGFYSGEDSNYLVFGQQNEEESEQREIMRVVKYSKDWVRQSACSVYGANTTIPFEAGSLRMAETGGKLYIHTCHEMYMADDGLNHQANMTCVVDEGSMTMLQSYYDVGNISQAGYVSHSFNQFVRTDGEFVYRVDHGDANPRAVALTRASVDGEITDVFYMLPLEINGYYGANATGVSAGGFELSDKYGLIAGNSVDQTNPDTYSAYGQRNIFLTVTQKDLLRTKTVWLTDYEEDSGITMGTPQLVKIKNGQFLLLWEERNDKTEVTVTKLVTVDGEGNQTSEIVSTGLRLSDCQPIFTADGMVKWYVSSDEGVRLYSVNPYRLDWLSDLIPNPDPDPDPDPNPDNPDPDQPNPDQPGTGDSNTGNGTIPGNGSSDEGHGQNTETVTKKPKLNATGTLPLQVKKSVTLKVTNLAAGDRVKSWKSSNAKVVKVSKKGKVRAGKKTGTAVVTVTLKSGKKAKVKIKVQKAPVKAKKITGLVKRITIKKGKKKTLRPSLIPITAEKKFNWRTANKRIARVSAKGVLTAVASGKTRVTVKCGRAKYTVTVQVTAAGK